MEIDSIVQSGRADDRRGAVDEYRFRLVQLGVAGIRRAVSVSAPFAATAARATRLCHVADDPSEHHRLLSRPAARSDLQSRAQAPVSGGAARFLNAALKSETAGAAALDRAHPFVDSRF